MNPRTSGRKSTWSRRSRHGSNGRRVAVLAIALLVGAGAMATDRFGDRKARRLARCMAIPANEYSTGLLFNPSGYQTMYHRSQCLQDLAVDERDRALCDEVRERRSLLFDGSGVSPAHCRDLVAARMAADTKDLEALDAGAIHRIETLAIERDGNGRDFDLVVTTSGSLSTGYELRIVARDESGASIEIFSNDGNPGASGSRRIFLLRAAELAEKLGKDWAAKTWTIVATLALAKTDANRFYYDRIPRAAHESRTEATIVFDELPPWHPR